MASLPVDRRPAALGESHRRSPAQALQAILARPGATHDHARAKLAIDRLVDPALDTKGTAAALECLASEATRLAAPMAGPDVRLAALRRLIYEPGPWNEWRPFAYDHSNFQGGD